MVSGALTTGNFRFGMFKGSDIDIAEQSLYAICMGESEDKFRAYTIADGISVLGGGGYVWYEDNKYKVMANIYENIDDANKVLSNISNTNYDTKVVELRLNKVQINVDGISKEDLSILNGGIDRIYLLYKDLYDLSNNIDTKDMTYIQASSMVNGYKSEFKIMHNKIMEVLAKYSPSKLQNILDTYVHIIDTLDNLVYKLLENNQSGFVIKNAEIDVVYKLYVLRKSL